MQALFEGLIDYAGLFPPAKLPMDDAVAQYRQAAGGPHAAMLERFIVPASRLGELPVDDLRLSVVIDESYAPLDRGGIELIEGKLPPADLLAMAPAGARVFAEVDPTDTGALDAVAAASIGAKVRCGGDAGVPSPADLAAFVQGCAERELAWKATAGLHHAFRTDAAHGFVNLLAAAGLPDRAEEVLAEQDPEAFALEDGTLTFRGEAACERRVHFVGYGSCSFTEPVEELQQLGWLS